MTRISAGFFHSRVRVLQPFPFPANYLAWEKAYCDSIRLKRPACQGISWKLPTPFTPSPKATSVTKAGFLVSSKTGVHEGEASPRRQWFPPSHFLTGPARGGSLSRASTHGNLGCPALLAVPKAKYCGGIIMSDYDEGAGAVKEGLAVGVENGTR